jgi:hypothetical protein
VRPAELIDAGRRHVGDLAGVEAESISGLRRDGDEAWVVTVEALELARVPSTMDLMGTYEVTLSDEGELVGFRRLGRYERSALQARR